MTKVYPVVPPPSNYSKSELHRIRLLEFGARTLTLVDYRDAEDAIRLSLQATRDLDENGPSNV